MNPYLHEAASIARNLALIEGDLTCIIFHKDDADRIVPFLKRMVSEEDLKRVTFKTPEQIDQMRDASLGHPRFFIITDEGEEIEYFPKIGEGK